jgi:hypothetical protein
MDPFALTRAIAAKLFVSKKNNETHLSAPTEKWGYVQINDDGSNTDLWPNRFEFRFQRYPPGPGEGTFPLQTTTFFNEYGEIRIAPAKPSTVPLRLFQKEFQFNSDHNEGVHLFEIMDNRSDRNILMGINNDGTIDAPNVQDKVVCVPSGTSGFASQPDGTLWVEYTP